MLKEKTATLRSPLLGMIVFLILLEVPSWLAFLILLEVFSWLIVRYMDFGLGTNADRHLYSPYRTHELNPDYQREWDTQGRKIHNRNGFRRDNPVEKRKADNVIRVIAMGTSTLYGLGVQTAQYYPLFPTLKNSETIPYFLEKSLNERLMKEGSKWRIEIINAAVTAYQTFGNVTYVLESLYEYNPDIVIFVEGHNDFYATRASNQYLNYTYGAVPLISAINDGSPLAGLFILSKWLGRYSHFFKLLEKVFQKRIESYSSTGKRKAEQKSWDFDYFEYAKDAFIRSYFLLRQLGNFYDFQISVFLQPEVLLEDAALLNPHDRNIFDMTLELSEEKLRLKMKERVAQLPKLFSQYEIPFYNTSQLAGEVSGKKDLYIDYCHLTPAGSEQAAKNIFPYLEEMIRARIRRQSTQ
jgi:lysophospholipase L1-like esterase